MMMIIANPAPKTMTPEYKQAELDHLISHNVNPIRGVSARRRELMADQQLDEGEEQIETVQ